MVEKVFGIGLAVLIQYRSVTDAQPASHVAVAITLNAQASSLKSYTKTKIDRAWFSRLDRHPATKRSGSILTTPEPAWGIMPSITSD